MTVPQLRRAFEHIDRFVAKKGQSVDAFRKEWKKTFGKEVSRAAAEEYLKFKAGRKGKMSGMSGGATQVFSPAPLDYDLRAGADIPHASYPKYVADGFGFANMDGFASGCGKENMTPTIPAGMGSNAVGGGRKRKTRKGKKQAGGSASTTDFFQKLGYLAPEIMSRPMPMQSPPSVINTASMLSKGYNEFASPRPEYPTFQTSITPNTYAAYVSPVSRAF